MTDAIRAWVDGYELAWDSNEPDDIASLFTERAAYRTSPGAEPAIGEEAIVALWLRGADRPGDHRFSWSLLGVDGQRHFVQGRTVYTDGRAYENLWVVDLADDGRAESFTEWWMESKEPGPSA